MQTQQQQQQHYPRKKRDRKTSLSDQTASGDTMSTSKSASSKMVSSEDKLSDDEQHVSQDKFRASESICAFPSKTSRRLGRPIAPVVSTSSKLERQTSQATYYADEEESDGDSDFLLKDLIAYVKTTPRLNFGFDEEKVPLSTCQPKRQQKNQKEQDRTMQQRKKQNRSPDLQQPSTLKRQQKSQQSDSLLSDSSCNSSKSRLTKSTATSRSSSRPLSQNTVTGQMEARGLNLAKTNDKQDLVTFQRGSDMSQRDQSKNKRHLAPSFDANNENDDMRSSAISSGSHVRRSTGTENTNQDCASNMSKNTDTVALLCQNHGYNAELINSGTSEATGQHVNEHVNPKSKSSLNRMVDEEGNEHFYDEAGKEITIEEAIDLQEADWHSPFNESTYTMIYMCKTRSQAFWYGVFIYTLQVVTISLTLIDIIDWADDGGNPLRIPPMVDLTVTCSQAVTLFLALAYQSDLIEAVLKLKDGFYPEVLEYHPGATFPTWLIACVAQLVAGLLLLTTIFVLTMQADNVISIMLNFAALHFMAESKCTRREHCL